jgi:ArsR family transcriptional regulator
MQQPRQLVDRLSRLVEVRQDIECPAAVWIKQLQRFASSIPDTILEKESNVLRSMSDPTRLKILHLLSQGRELCVCEIQVAVGQSQPLTSHHLNELRKAGIVVSRRTGTWVYYRLANNRLARTLDALRELTQEDRAILLKT